MLRRVIREEQAPVVELLTALLERLDRLDGRPPGEQPSLPAKLSDEERERWRIFAQEHPELIRKAKRRGTIRRHVKEGRSPFGRTLEEVWEEIKGPGAVHELVEILHGDSEAAA